MRCGVESTGKIGLNGRSRIERRRVFRIVSARFTGRELAEELADERRKAGEAPFIVFRGRGFPAIGTQLDFHAQDRPEKGCLFRLGHAGQVILDCRPRALFPRRFEAVARRVHTPVQRERRRLLRHLLDSAR